MKTLILYMVIPRRIDFLQLERILTSDRKAIAIDPSYISKSGKNTPWIGDFWSGAAGQAKQGLEILGVDFVYIDNKDCICLQAVLTAVNLAKVFAKERGIPFPMASCKTMIHNDTCLNDLFVCRVSDRTED